MSSTQPRQRRSKKSSERKSIIQTDTNEGTSDRLKEDTSQKVNNILSQLIQNKIKLLTLQSDWRSYLNRLTIFVSVLCIIQMYQSMHSCKEMMEGSMYSIADRSTLYLFFKEFSSDVAGFLSIIALLFYLDWEQQFSPCNKDPSLSSTTVDSDTPLYPPVFDHWTYQLSSTLCGLGLMMYVRLGADPNGESEGDVISTTEKGNWISCIETRKREVPVSLIFFFIVTGACFFMNYGITKVDGQIKTLNELKENLETAQKIVKDKQEFVDEMNNIKKNKDKKK